MVTAFHATKSAVILPCLIVNFAKYCATHSGRSPELHEWQFERIAGDCGNPAFGRNKLALREPQEKLLEYFQTESPECLIFGRL
jgi:hypothetical protein